MPRRLLTVFASLAIASLAATDARANRFEDIAAALGLPPGNPGVSSGRSLVASISAVDIDRDGDIDLVVNEPVRGLVIYLREGALFRPAPEWTDGFIGDGYGHTLFDMDGDGDLDLFVARNKGDLLLRNQGDKLVDVTDGHLPRLPGWSLTGTAADIDGDGDLDLLVARYIDRIEFPAHRCLDNLVLANDGRGRFSDVSAPTGLRETRGCSFVTVVFDLDQDGDLDLFTANDFSQFAGKNELWRNQGRDADGQPLFAEVSQELGFDAPVYGMGMAIGDLDQNGQLDFFVTNIGEPLLFELGSDQRFVDRGAARGLSLRFAADRNAVTWSTRMLDLDRDGHLDLIAASGELAAADFIGNGPDMPTVWLRGTAAGTLVEAVGDDAITIPGGSTRDFVLSDIDGDARPELVMIHMHGGVSILRDRNPGPLPTTLVLVPSTTAPGAAGAEVTLACDGVVRTRQVLGGGAYGNADSGEVDFAFPAPCDSAGRPLGGTIRWPSGFVQTITAVSGQRARIAEPAWLSLTPDRLEVDLSGHAEPFDGVTPLGFGVTFGVPRPLGPRHWRWPLSRVDATGALSLALDGVPMGMLVRVGVRPFEVWFDPPRPIAGKPLTVFARFEPPGANASVRLAGGPVVRFEPFDGQLARATLDAPVEGPAILELTDPGGSATGIPLEVLGPISEERSELTTRELHVLASDVASSRVRLRLRLRDENNAASDIPLDAIELKVDGVILPTVERAYDGDTPTLVVAHSELHDRAELQLVVAGRDRFAPQRVAQLMTADALGPLVAAERSFCALSEPRLRADGSDIGTALLQLFDAQGARLPDLDAVPRFETDGLAVVPAEVRSGYGGWLVPVHAGLAVMSGRLSARLAGQTSAVSCRVALVAAPGQTSIAPDSPLVSVFGQPELDALATFRFVPRGHDGRALGSGARFRFEITGAEPEPLVFEAASSYVGLGRYEVSVVPRLAGDLLVAIVEPDALPLVGLTFALLPPAAESGPEQVEQVEPHPDTAATDAGDEDVIAEPEADVLTAEVAEATDTGAQDTAVPEPRDADGVSDDDTPSATEAPDAAPSEADLPHDTNDGFEVAELPIAEPTPIAEATELESGRGGDEGCAGGPRSLPLIAAWMLALRRRWNAL